MFTNLILLAGRRRSDAEHYDPCDRSEFYHMSDLDKPPAIFVAGLDDFEPQVCDGY
jgi:hypothetical protein